MRNGRRSVNVPDPPGIRHSAANREWAALIEVARPIPNPERFTALTAERSVDWPRLLALAEQHGLAPLLSARLRDIPDALIPPSQRERLQESARSHAAFHLALIAELFRLLGQFRAANIELLATKGPTLAVRCYGDPSLRQYSDLDFVVRTKDIGQATAVMAALGYEGRIPMRAIASGKSPGEYAFRRPGTSLLVEFHTEHTFRYHPRRMPIERVFARKTCVQIDGRPVSALSLEDELVLICIHAAKHLWERLGWVSDVAALVTRNSELNWERAVSAASEVAAERMLRVGLRLAVDLLSMPLSPEVAAYLDSDLKAAQIAKQIAQRLPHTGSAHVGIFSRALFRSQMREGFLPGLSYLLRLTLSPTEDDWTHSNGSKLSLAADAVGRPFRLARKYRRESERNETGSVPKKRA